MNKARQSAKPIVVKLKRLSRLSWCIVGAAIGISLALSVVAPPASPIFLASLGGTTIFLFGLTRAPAAQPRALFGGHLGGAAIGIACYQWLGDGLWVYALAQVLTLSYMLLTGTVHPPAGANPILMIYTHAQWSALWQPVLLGISILAACAMIWSRLYPGMIHYPNAWLERSPASLFWGGWEDEESK